MKCPNCGVEIRDNSTFCGYCGEKLIVSQVTPQPKDSRDDPVPPRRWFPWMAVLLVVILAIIAVAALAITGKINLPFFRHEYQTQAMANASEADIPLEAVSLKEHRYLLIQDSGVTSFEQAAEYCREHDGYLASITTKEENDFLASYIQQQGCSFAFFGLNDQEEEGVWTYINGESVLYTNWDDDEPNNETEEENFAGIYQNGKWNDAVFNGAYAGNAFLIEWGSYEISSTANESEQTSPASESKGDNSSASIATNSTEISNILEPIAYYGRKDSCKLSPKMASAYAEVLYSLPESKRVEYLFEKGDLKAALFDIAGDGYPLLAVVYQGYSEDFGTEANNEVVIWDYFNGKARQIQPDFEIWNCGLEIMMNHSPNYLVFQDGEMQDVVGAINYLTYSVSKGTVTYYGKYQYRSGYCSEDDIAVYYDLQGNEKKASQDQLRNMGWTPVDEYGTWGCLYYEGTPTDRTHESFTQSLDEIASYDYEGYLSMDFISAAGMISALNAIAKT